MPLVFAYGSLVTLGGLRAVLPGHRRTWDVAMDNALALPGYKRFADPLTGAHPAVRVAFLDLALDVAAQVEGVLLDVPAAELAALDARERNYVRGAVELEGGERAWTYLGTPEGRARAGEQPVVVQRAYLDAVRAAYGALAPGALARFDASTDPPPGPLVGLVREEL